MSQSRRRTEFSCLLVILLCTCLCATLVGGAVVFLPILVERSFGPVASEISPQDHLYLTAILLLQKNDLLRPTNPTGIEKPFQISLGESPTSIANRLEDEKLIRSAQAFRAFLVYSGLDTTLQAGDYSLSPKLTPVQIARLLQDATPSQIDFNVLPGWRLEEISAALPTSGLQISPEAFLAAVSRPPAGYEFLSDMPPLASLEGFMYPDSYRLARTTTVDELVALFLANFELHLSKDLLNGFERQGLSLFEAVTLASIVEREAVLEAEMPKIASVFINRLSAGMKLDSDPTVQYALGYNHGQKTWWTNPLSSTDLTVNSPFNTYRVPNLPPGPISSPSLTALKAVAEPSQTPYFYFRAACDGSGRHNFSETFDQHLQKGCP